MLFYEDKEHHFTEMFDPRTGFYARGEDPDGNDPFMRDFPALMDIGIMGSCVHGRSGLCKKAGIDCYQNGLHVCKPDMSLEDYTRLMEEADGRCFQVALGGRGDPDMHKDFAEILAVSRAHNVVPNFTTSGLGMTDEKAKLCKTYCGAVAVSSYSRLDVVYGAVPEDSPIKEVYYMEPCRHYGNDRVWDSRDEAFWADGDNNLFSWHEGWLNLEGIEIHFDPEPIKVKPGQKLVRVFYETQNYTNDAIRMLRKAGVQTNMHFVLGRNTIREAKLRLQYNLFPKGLHAVVFLLYKPIGQGTTQNMLTMEETREFFELIDNYDGPLQIGFDSCSIPGIINLCKNIEPASIDSCEGARYSMYITADMVALPCSFDNVDQRWAFDLKDGRSIKEAWDSPVFERFRDHHRNSCPNCPHRAECKGGCPICPEIVLCNSVNLDN